MRQIIIIMLLCIGAYNTKAQTGEEGDEPLAIRVLALDTNVDIAKRFCEAMGGLLNGYNLAFIDNEVRYNVRYVFKNAKNETLRVDYRYSLEENAENTKAPKRAVVNYQSISGELSAIRNIYNFLFNANLTPEKILTSSTQGSPISYRGKEYEFTLLPDDYEAGYWIMTFR